MNFQLFKDCLFNNIIVFTRTNSTNYRTFRLSNEFEIKFFKYSWQLIFSVIIWSVLDPFVACCVGSKNKKNLLQYRTDC